MVTIQYVTAEACPDRACDDCATAEALQHRVLAACGPPLPEPFDGHPVEPRLADGRLVESEHLGLAEASPGLESSLLPCLLVDGTVVLVDAGNDVRRLGAAVVRVLCAAS